MCRFEAGACSRNITDWLKRELAKRLGAYTCSCSRYSRHHLGRTGATRNHPCLFYLCPVGIQYSDNEEFHHATSISRIKTKRFPFTNVSSVLTFQNTTQSDASVFDKLTGSSESLNMQLIRLCPYPAVTRHFLVLHFSCEEVLLER